MEWEWLQPVEIYELEDAERWRRSRQWDLQVLFLLALPSAVWPTEGARPCGTELVSIFPGYVDER